MLRLDVRVDLSRRQQASEACADSGTRLLHRLGAPSHTSLFGRQLATVPLALLLRCWAMWLPLPPLRLMLLAA
jgi:hypothetical protein